MITVVPLDRNRNDWSRLYARQYSAESGTAIDPASVLTTPRPRWAAYATAPLDRAPLVASLVGVAQTNPDRDATFVRLYVRDDARRLGAGLALFDVVRATAAPPKLRSVVLTDGPGARFAERLGASVAMHLVVMALRFDADRAIRPMPPGYKLVTWSDAAPAELLDSYAAAKSHIADAPGVAHQLDPDWTPARIRAWEASRSVFVAAAVAMAWWSGSLSSKCCPSA